MRTISSRSQGNEIIAWAQTSDKTAISEDSARWRTGVVLAAPSRSWRERADLGFLLRFRYSSNGVDVSTAAEIEAVSRWFAGLSLKETNKESRKESCEEIRKESHKETPKDTHKETRKEKTRRSSKDLIKRSSKTKNEREDRGVLAGRPQLAG